MAELWQGDLWGDRRAKGEALWTGTADSLAFTPLPPKAAQYPFVARNYEVEDIYERGFSVGELMTLNSNGIVTARDSLTIASDRFALWTRLKAFAVGDPETNRARYRLGKDVRDWKIDWAQSDLLPLDEQNLKRISYRPFETHWTYFTGRSRGIHCYPRNEVMRNYLEGPNLGLLVSKAHKDAAFAHAFVTSAISEAIFLSGTTASNAMNLPLYRYPDETAQGDAFAAKQRTLNFDPKLYAALCKAAGIDPADTADADAVSNSPSPNPSPEGEGYWFRRATGEARPSEVKLFDYIYGVLHAPAYRETFAEFLKIDFPRIPYPPSPAIFRTVSEAGEQLRRLHLMEPQAIGDTPYLYRGDGDDVVGSGFPKWEPNPPSPSGEGKGVGDVSGPSPDKPHPNPSPEGEGHRTGRVQINKDQHFADVPEIAWSFHIGGYQPAQKWLKDRRGRSLSFDDITHYQRIVKILAETGRIMAGIVVPIGGAAEDE